MIDKILEFADSHSKTVIVVLFSIIVGGSVLGGIWITSLKDQISTQQEINLKIQQLQSEGVKRDIDEILIDVKRQQKTIEFIKTLTKNYLKNTDSLFYSLKSRNKDLTKQTLNEIIYSLESSQSKLKKDLHEQEEYYSSIIKIADPKSELEDLKGLHLLDVPSFNFIWIILALGVVLMFFYMRQN